MGQTGTALVNVITMTSESARLKQSLEALKKEYEGSTAQFKSESERGNQMTEKLRTLTPNSPEFKKLEQEVTKLRADFELHGKRVTNDVQDRESKLYFAFSKELREEVARYAQASGVQLVLRYDVSPPELTDPRAILQEVHKLVVYQRGVEITPVVVEAMNRKVPASTAAKAPPAQSRPVQR